MLDTEINYYKENKKEFISLYAGKFLVIKGAALIGVYDTRSRAFDEAVKLHVAGSFIIEHPIDLK